MACRILGVSRSGFYDWRGRPPSGRDEENTLLLTRIREVHEHSRGTYGWPRIDAELVLGMGIDVNHKRVRRLMRQAGLQGLYRRGLRGCTIRNPADQPAGDLVNREFTVTGPNRLWLTDITEHPTEEGKLYCAAVMDAHSRRSSAGPSPTTCVPTLSSTHSAWPTTGVRQTGPRSVRLPGLAWSCPFSWSRRGWCRVCLRAARV